MINLDFYTASRMDANLRRSVFAPDSRLKRNAKLSPNYSIIGPQDVVLVYDSDKSYSECFRKKNSSQVLNLINVRPQKYFNNKTYLEKLTPIELDLERSDLRQLVLGWDLIITGYPDKYLYDIIFLGKTGLEKIMELYKEFEFEKSLKVVGEY